MRHRKGVPTAGQSARQAQGQKRERSGSRVIPMGFATQVKMSVRAECYFPHYGHLKQRPKALIDLRRGASSIGMTMSYICERPTGVRHLDVHLMMSITAWGESWFDWPVWWRWQMDTLLTGGWHRSRRMEGTKAA